MMNNLKIFKPTLVLNERVTRQNISRMADKARRQGVRLRPHFKTHQSAAVGEWFRDAGISAITVSSLDMAIYFADAGWDDITIAFPANPLEMDKIREFSTRISLGIILDAPDYLAYSRYVGAGNLSVWIEIDEGSGRSGVQWDDRDALIALAQEISSTPTLELKGLLTHAGRTYHAGSPVEIVAIYNEALERMISAKKYLHTHGFNALEISVGDTPACTLVDDFGSVDEIRPGNYIFYDVTQLQLGVCRAEDISLAVACPVVSIHIERSEVVIYGGAVHLSKDTAPFKDRKIHGLVCLPVEDGWCEPLPGAFLDRLSQEHGVIHMPRPFIERVRIGDLLYVLPAHSCLAVSALPYYRTLDGQILETMA